MRTVSEKITDSDSKVMIRVQQAGGRGDDSVTVCVGIVAEGDVEPVLEFDQAGHGGGTGAIHADFAVMIDCHECKSGVDIRVHYRDVQTVAFSYRFPVRQRRSAERISADLHTCGTDDVQINDA